ncbi:MAG: hypothetical protein AB1640_18355 [bacterium]
MKLEQAMRSNLWRTGLFLKGKSSFPLYHDMLRLQYGPLDENLQIQRQKLKQILVHAWRHVPYYTPVLERAGVVQNGQVQLENLRSVPLLTKKDIRENYDRLVSRDPARERRRPYVNTSGGSTGEPVRFLQDREYFRHMVSGKWMFHSFVEPFPYRYIKLWASERDFFFGGTGLRRKLANWLQGQRLLNTFRMSDPDMLHYISEINRYRPAVIEAYVQSIYELALFIEKNRLEVFSPKGIITSAGVLYPKMKSLIEEVFRCRTYNRYGSREVGDLACSCRYQTGLHLNVFLHHVEILNELLQPCRPGEAGEVYVTTLENFSMPLIRFRIGDVAVPSDTGAACPCGRGLPLIENLVGRATSMIRTRKGAVDCVAISTSLYFFNSLKRYQFVQKAIDLIQMNVSVTDLEIWRQDKVRIEEKLKKILGDDVAFEFNLVDEIPETPSGKYLYFINEMAA